MPRTPKLAIAARVLLVPYLIVLAMIVWLPASVASRVTGVVSRIARFASERLDISMSTTYTAFEFLANIALFVPLGALIAVAWPSLRLWHIALLGLATSGAIELGQTMLPSRFPTVSDIIANTTGAAIGWMLLRPVAHAIRPAHADGRRSRSRAAAERY